jgi:lipoprotein LprG
LVAVSCHGSESLPPAAGLLQRAAAEMGTVKTVGFSLDIQGPLGPLSIRRADGVLTTGGDVQGSVSLDQGGSLIEYQVVIADGRFFLKGPTGGYQEIPASLAQASFDPASLLDPKTGVAGIVDSAAGAETVAAESVNGTKAYRVDARITVDALADVLPLGANRKGLAASLWIGADRPLVLKVEVVAPATGSEGPSTVTVTLDRVNEPVAISTPSV